ncbi:hypothetical protein RCL1_000602 [Eukaryota sp. TZLM3-RCL]
MVFLNPSEQALMSSQQALACEQSLKFSQQSLASLQSLALVPPNFHYEGDGKASSSFYQVNSRTYGTMASPIATLSLFQKQVSLFQKQLFPME